MLERRKRMLGINGKQWNDIQWTDVEEFLNEIEESFFFEFKKDEVSGAKLIKEIAALANTYGGYVFLGVHFALSGGRKCVLERPLCGA